jgi:hypothetical protein
MANFWILPDWNSLESIRFAHSVLEAGAIIFFAALVFLDTMAHSIEEKNPLRSRAFERIGLWCFAVAVLAEIVAYPYSQRNDFLADERDRQRGVDIQRLGTQTRQISDEAVRVRKQLRDARDDAAVAKADASRARGDIAEAVDLARTARQEADSFERDIRTAKERAAKADEQAAKAEEHLADTLRRAEAAERAEQQLEDRFTGWKLSGAALDRLREKLKAFQGTPYDLYVDPVSESFMDTVDSLLANAGWVRHLAHGPGDVSTIFESKAQVSAMTGITIGVPREAPGLEKAALALIGGLMAEGITVKSGWISSEDKSSKDAIHIMIGRRE